LGRTQVGSCRVRYSHNSNVLAFQVNSALLLSCSAEGKQLHSSPGPYLDTDCPVQEMVALLQGRSSDPNCTLSQEPFCLTVGRSEMRLSSKPAKVFDNFTFGVEINSYFCSICFLKISLSGWQSFHSNKVQSCLDFYNSELVPAGTHDNDLRECNGLTGDTKFKHR
jgi:hypothetical protein